VVNPLCASASLSRPAGFENSLLKGRMLKILSALSCLPIPKFIPSHLCENSATTLDHLTTARLYGYEVLHIDRWLASSRRSSTAQSYQDMADRIEILLRGLKRRLDAKAARRRIDRDDAPE
jgi:hypothetical protein